MCCNIDNNPKIFEVADLIERGAEVIDESYHVAKDVIKSVFSKEIASFIGVIHEGAHNFEHLLHSFCFTHSLYHIYEGNFFKGKVVDVVARICHFISHLLAPVALLIEVGVVKLGEWLGTINLVASVCSALGFLVNTISSIWKKIMDPDHGSLTDIALHISGLIYHCFSIVQFAVPVVAVYTAVIQASSGVVHAALFIYKLVNKEEHHHHQCHNPH